MYIVYRIRFTIAFKNLFLQSFGKCKHISLEKTVYDIFIRIVFGFFVNVLLIHACMLVFYDIIWRYVKEFRDIYLYDMR